MKTIHDFPDIQISLSKDAESILSAINHKGGNEIEAIVDVISCLRTTISSIELKIRKLQDEYEKQKWEMAKEPLARLKKIQGEEIAVQVMSKEWARKLWQLSDRLEPRGYDYSSRIETMWDRHGENSAYVFCLPLIHGIEMRSVEHWKGLGYEIISVEKIFE